MSERLPELVSARRFAEESGISREQAKYLIRSMGLPLVRPPGTRSVFVYRSDLERALTARRA